MANQGNLLYCSDEIACLDRVSISNIPHVGKLDIGSPQINSLKRSVKENIRIDVQIGSINEKRYIDDFFGKRRLVVVTL